MSYQDPECGTIYVFCETARYPRAGLEPDAPTELVLSGTVGRIRSVRPEHYVVELTEPRRFVVVPK